MEVFVKSFAAYRTIKKATTLSYAFVLDSLDTETSTVTVKGTAVNLSDTGNWLVTEFGIYLISNVKPQVDRTVLTLSSPLDAFSRPLELAPQVIGQTIGGFIAAQLQTGWVNEDDPNYAAPYLVVSNSDTTAFVPPNQDNGGTFKLPDYCRLMRKSYRVVPIFTDAGRTLQCSIRRVSEASQQIVFNDGRSQLKSVDYSASGIAKLTVLHDIDTGEKGTNGDKVYRRERTVWYLSETGEVSQLVPARRASGAWSIIHIQGDKDVQAKVIETFAKNKFSHKLEFWSEIDINVHTDCTLLVYGELLRSHISYKRKDSDNQRYYYKSGELATTATEKLKGALK